MDYDPLTDGPDIPDEYPLSSEEKFPASGAAPSPSREHSPSSHFRPPLLRGLVIHIATAALLLLGVLLGLWQAFEQQIGVRFIQYLLFALILVVPLPVVIYRAYTLFRAEYNLDRDGLRLRWGLRAEDIPLTDIEWVRLANDLVVQLPQPPLAFSRFLQGSVHAEGLGAVEYMASDPDLLLLVATPHKIFAISPAEPALFLRTFQEAFESGSLTPLQAGSSLPNALLAGVWSDRAARLLAVIGFVTVLALFTWVSLIIPGFETLSIGYDPLGNPLPPGPPERLLMLPVLALLTYAIDLIMGTYFYRRAEWRTVAYLIWGSSILTPLLLFGAIWGMV